MSTLSFFGTGSSPAAELQKMVAEGLLRLNESDGSYSVATEGKAPHNADKLLFARVRDDDVRKGLNDIKHNKKTVAEAFYGTLLTEQAPAETQDTLLLTFATTADDDALSETISLKIGDNEWQWQVQPVESGEGRLTLRSVSV